MKQAGERMRFLPLLAGNLVAVAFLAIAFCAQFLATDPLWLLQAPYFAAGAGLALVLTPLELWFLRKVQLRVPNVFIEALLTALVSALLGIPGGLLVGAMGLMRPPSLIGADPTGWWGYVVVGGSLIAGACFFCALVGRLVAEGTRRAPWLSYVIGLLSVVNLGLAVVYFATRT